MLYYKIGWISTRPSIPILLVFYCVLYCVFGPLFHCFVDFVHFSYFVFNNRFIHIFSVGCWYYFRINKRLYKLFCCLTTKDLWEATVKTDKLSEVELIKVKCVPCVCNLVLLGTTCPLQCLASCQLVEAKRIDLCFAVNRRTTETTL